MLSASMGSKQKTLQMILGNFSNCKNPTNNGDLTTRATNFAKADIGQTELHLLS